MQRYQFDEEAVPEPTAWVAGRDADAAELALSLLSFDTQNPPGHTDDVVEWVDSTVREWGLESRRIAENPDKPNLVVRIPGDTDRTLLFNGHLDTVPYNPDRWNHDPLGEWVGERLYGRGAEDMKGPIASLLLVARAFVETDTTPPVDLEFAFVSDEEVGGRYGTAALLEGGAVDPDACVVAETTSAVDRPSVTVAERGRLWLTLEAKGRAAHGSRPMLGVNAIDRLTAAIEGCRRTLADAEPAIDPAVESVVRESIDYYAHAMDREDARAMFEHPTVNLGRIEGGEAINSVPERASARLDVRVTPSVDPTEVLRAVCDVLDDHEGVSVRDVTSSAGSYEAADSPIIEPAVAATRHVTDGPVYRRCASGSSDARLLRNDGVPTVELGLGVGTAHATDEHTTVEALVGNAAIYSQLPYRYA